MSGQYLEQQLNQTQNLALTPAIMLSLKVLQLPLDELTQFLKERALANPVIDITDGERFVSGYSGYRSYERSGDYDNPIPDRSPLSLYNYLDQQTVFVTQDAKQERLVRFIIGNLEPDGYLRTPLAELANIYGESASALEEALDVVQQCDPPGVGARTLPECLWLQTSRRYGPDHLLARIIKDHWVLLKHASAKRLAQALKIAPAQAGEVIKLLKTLTPNPFSLADGAPTDYVQPDILAMRHANGEIVIEFNRDIYPSLQYVPEYLQIKKRSHDPSVQSFLGEAFREARTLERALSQRAQTLIRVARSMVRMQAAFCFDDAPLSPLTVKSVAGDTGFHESTVRRAVAHKWIQCSQGIFPLSHLLCEAIVMSSDASVDLVKKNIRLMIADEDRRKPLSDAQISLRLAQHGVPVARRTVANYREQLGLLPSPQRREWYLLGQS